MPRSGGRILLSIDEGGNERGSCSCSSRGRSRSRSPSTKSIRRSECVSHDGKLVGYASNRRNGVDFDVYVQPIDEEDAWSRSSAAGATPPGSRRTGTGSPSSG